MKTVFIRAAFLVLALMFTPAWGDDQYERALIFDWVTIETPRENVFHGEARCEGPGFQLFINHPNPFGWFHRYTGECWDPLHGVIYDAKVDLRDGTVKFVEFEQTPQLKGQEPHGSVIHFRGKLRDDEMCGVLVTVDVKRGDKDVKWPEVQAECVKAKLVEMPQVPSREKYLLEQEKWMKFGLWWKDAPDGKEPALFKDLY